jgi:DNA-binding FadR family transcriptional regulator
MDPDVLAWQAETGLDESFLRNLVEVRYLIEPAAARLAAVRRTEEDIKLLEESYSQMEAHVFTSEAYIAADMQLHFGILAACYNEILEEMNIAIGEALAVSRKVTVETPGSSEAHLPLHKDLVEAIRERNPQAAESAMRKLIERVQSDIDRFVQKNDPGVKPEVGGTTAAGDASLRLIDRGTEPVAEQGTNNL